MGQLQRSASSTAPSLLLGTRQWAAASKGGAFGGPISSILSCEVGGYCKEHMLCVVAVESASMPHPEVHCHATLFLYVLSTCHAGH